MQVVVDGSRHILYTRSDKGTLQVNTHFLTVVYMYCAFIEVC